MEILKSSAFRWGVFVGIIATGLVIANNPFGAIIGMLLCFGVWNTIYVYLVPRSQFGGGVAILVLCMFVFLFALASDWVALIGLPLLAHGNWLAFTGAARLDE